MSPPRLPPRVLLPPGDVERRELIVIDDEPSVLAATVLCLDTPEWSPRGFSDPVEALMFASDADPTCIIADLKIPGIEDLDLVAAFCALRRHGVIILSAYIDVQMTVEAMRTGVDNVLVKPTSPEQLADAVRKTLAALDAAPVQDHLTFTRRERQVAELIVAGKRTKEIALDLGISPRTVEFFRASLLRKTHSTSTAGLGAALMRVGFYPDPKT